MTKKIFLPLMFVFFLALAASIAYAEERGITFPIADLGGCTSRAECKTYCDDPAHSEVCFSFAESHGMMSSEEVAQARKFSGQVGPGGCRGGECRSYCSDSANREECVVFAKDHGLTPPPSRAEMETRIRERSEFRPEVDEPSIDEERAMRAVEENGGPGGCSTKDECRAFCDEEGNTEICFAFAEEHTLMSPEDLERARAMMAKEGPGGCKGVQCKTYCENADHSEECLLFAEQEGFIKPEEAMRARKLMNATGPGGCRGKECQQYCEDTSHQKECFEFAVQNGLISEEEAGRVRDFMGEMRDGGEMNGIEGMRDDGPGGCNGLEECMRYCSEHPDECKGFGPPPSESNGHDFGQERAIEQRGFEMPQGQMPCKTPEECRALYEEHSSNFRPLMDGRKEERAERMQNPPQYFPGGIPNMPSQFEQRSDSQYQQEYQEQYQQQYQQYEGTGSMPPPSEPPPPNMESAPQSRINSASLTASIGVILRSLLGF